MPISPADINKAAWIVFCVYWLWAARNQKRVQRRESVLARLFHVAYMVAGFMLLYSTDPRLAALNRRFLPDLRWTAMLGAILTVLGVAFAIWARMHIGKNWSGQVTIRQDHELIRTVRRAHPPSDLHRVVARRCRNGDSDWRVSRRFGVCDNSGRLYGEGEERRIFARVRIRPRIRRASPPHGFFPAFITVPLRFLFSVTHAECFATILGALFQLCANIE